MFFQAEHLTEWFQNKGMAEGDSVHVHTELLLLRSTLIRPIKIEGHGRICCYEGGTSKFG